MKPLWQREPRGTHPVAQPTTHNFSVLGERFAYQPDDMRLLHLNRPDEPLPTWGSVQAGMPGRLNTRPIMLVLNLTHACTLRCRYCFVGENTSPVMSLETAREALSLLPRGREVKLSFFGGEPLLARERLVEIVDLAVARAAQEEVRTRFHLTTNGTRLDNAMASFLDDYRFSLIVSLDGPAHLHDPVRPYADGHGSYNDVLTALQCVSRYPALARRTTLRATFDGSNTNLLARLKHLNHLADQFGFGGVSVEPADLSEGCAGGGIPVHPSEALYEEYMDAAEWYLQELRAGKRPKFHHFAVRLRRLRLRERAFSECGAGVGYLAVDPGGTLHACHRLATPLGTVAEGVRHGDQKEWLDNRYHARTDCPACPWRNLCGGGCRWVSRVHHGDITTPDALGCFLTDTCAKAAAWILSQTA